MDLPAVHLTIDDLSQIENIIINETTNCNIEILLLLPGGVEQKFRSSTQINRNILADSGGSNSYTITAVGEEGKCIIAGESAGTESHKLYCDGDPGWKENVRNELIEYFNSVQTRTSRIRGRLTGGKAVGVAVLAALFVGWSMSAITPQSIVHYFPTFSDALLFSIGIFGLLVVRYRNWLHPYIWVGEDHPYPSKLRISKLMIFTILLTLAILIIRWWIRPGPFLR